MTTGLDRFMNQQGRAHTRDVGKRAAAMIAIASLALSLAGCGGALTPTGLQADHGGAGNPGKIQHYTIEDLGVVGANATQPGQPLIIADNGWVSGATGVGGAEHAALWRNGKLVDIGAPGLGGNSMGYGVNLLGMVTGEAETNQRGLSTTEDFCGFQAMGFSTSSTPCVPFVWIGGRITELKTLGGVNGVANGISDLGEIAGYAETRSVDPGCTAPQKYQFKPVVWFLNQVQELSTGKDSDGVAYAVNDEGDAVGASGTCAPFNFVWFFNFQPTRALLWRNGRATDLGNLGGSLNNMAHDINNFGQVVGGSDLAGDDTSHAFLWSGSKMQDLGTLSGDFYSFGLGINDSGQVVGLSANADFSVVRAFVRQNGALVDLNTLVSGNNPLFLMTACSINAKGQIIGLALDPNTGETHGYLANPSN